MTRYCKLSKLSLSIVLCACITTSLHSQLENKVDGVGIKNIILTIASDKFMGRETGTRGCEMAEEYFAGEFKKLNLAPAGENNTYFHTYPFSYYKVDGDVNLVVDKRIFYYGRGEDFRIEGYSDGGNASGEIVFAGYGINSLEKKRNDFEGLDIKGKIVLVKRGCPGNDWGKWKDAAVDSVKASYCYQNDAAGMLFFEPAQTGQFQAPPPVSNVQVSNQLSQYKQIKNFPIFRIDERVSRYILQNSDPGYNNLLRKIDTTVVGFNTSRNARMSARVTYDRERKVRNVLAMIPGSDPLLKDEAVIIGGHIDHVGTDFDGKINNGADDNASGPSVTLGIAQAMVKNNFKPKRTVIFAGWSGEEEGLLGATAWCRKPTWDLNKVVVYFNLDMVGVGEPKLNFPGMYYGAEVWKLIKENTDTTTLAKVTPSRGGPGGSDHTPFLQKGVPAFFGITSGPHPDYHQPSDDPEKTGVDIVQFVGDFIYHCADLAANSTHNFLGEKRNSTGKFKLATIYNPSPVNYSNYKDLLSNEDIDASFVNLTEKYDLKNSDQNFISTLKLIDEALKSNQTKKDFSFVQNPNDAAGLSYQNKIGLAATANLEAFNYNDVYCKALAKAGIKIGMIDASIPCAQDTADKKKTLQSIADGGMILMLNNFTAEKLLNVFNQVEKPMGIICSSTNALSDPVIEKMKSKGHLFFYAFSPSASTADIIETIVALKAKLGNENFTVCPAEWNTAGYEKLRDVYIAADKKYADDDFPGKLFTDNIRRFMTKALQETTQRVATGRPF